MALIRRFQVIWTGVAGSPAYTNLYTLGDLDSVTAQHSAVAALVGSLSTNQTSAVTGTVQGEVALIDTATGQITGSAFTAPVSHTGKAAGNRLPLATSIVLRWTTGVYINGRRLRGRTYLPYLGSGTAAPDGTVGAATMGAIGTAMNAYLTAQPAACIYSPTHGVADVITAGSVWNQFGVQRSRRD